MGKTVNLVSSIHSTIFANSIKQTTLKKLNFSRERWLHIWILLLLSRVPEKYTFLSQVFLIVSESIKTPFFQSSVEMVSKILAGVNAAKTKEEAVVWVAIEGIVSNWIRRKKQRNCFQWVNWSAVDRPNYCRRENKENITGALIYL